MTYQARRVPISLLQQKVFSTSHRLEKWPAERKVIEKPTVFLATSIETKKNGLVLVHSLKTDIFEKHNYLRRFYYTFDGEKLICRGCAEQLDTLEERTKHSRTCYLDINNTISRILADNLCAVCEEKLDDRTPSNIKKGHLPICSDACLMVWDHYSPSAFQEEMEITGSVQERMALAVLGGIKDE